MVGKKWQFTKPIRVGHLTLIEKYNRLFKPSDDLRKKWISFILQNILPVVAKQNYSLDFNVAGLRKKDCMSYLYTELLESCKNFCINIFRIGLIYSLSLLDLDCPLKCLLKILWSVKFFKNL